MRSIVAAVAALAALGPIQGHLPTYRQVITDVAEDQSTATQLRASIDQQTGKEDINLVIIALGDEPLSYDQATYMTDGGITTRSLAHSTMRFRECRDVNCPLHATASLSFTADFLEETVDEGEPLRLHLEANGKQTGVLSVPAAVVRDFLSRMPPSR